MKTPAHRSGKGSQPLLTLLRRQRGGGRPLPRSPDRARPVVKRSAYYRARPVVSCQRQIRLGGKRSAYYRARLETFRNAYPERDYWIHFECPEFTALCPITGQPDFGTIAIDYVPDRVCLESKSLKLYLFSFRNYGTFHEAAVNRILDDIRKVCCPRRLRVTGRFNPRGGIAITVTAEHPAGEWLMGNG